MDKRLASWVLKSGVALLLMGAATGGQAQYYGSPERAGRWEGSVGMRYQDFGAFNFDGPSKLEVDDSIGFGFNFAYHFDNHWSLGFEMAWGDADYDGTVLSNDAPAEDVTLSGELDTSTGQLLATWHMFEGSLTPFVSAGIGWTYIDSNIISDYEGSACWWDPWYWGYSCGSFYDTYDDTVLSYSASIGVRWDITPVVFLRGSIGQNWLDLDNGGSTATDLGRLEIGMMF